LYFPEATHVFVDQSGNPPQSDLIPFPKPGGTITLSIVAGTGTYQYAAYRKRSVAGQPERKIAEGNSPPEIIIP
jgi:hypothetical protein